MERNHLADRLPQDLDNLALTQEEIPLPPDPKLERGPPHRVVTAAVAYFAIYLLWQVTRLGGPAHTTIIGDAFFIPADLLAVYTTVTAMRRSRADPRRYRSWGFLAVAMVGYLLGQLLQGYHEALRHLPDSPDATDALFYACFFAGLLGFAASRRNVARRWLFTVDAVTVALSGGAVLWYFVAGTLATGKGHSLHSVVYAIVYPLGDLMLLLAAVRTLQRGVQRSSHAAVLTIAAGILMYVVDDTIVGYLGLHGSYHGGDRVDIVAMTATILFVIAGGLQSQVAADEAAPRARRTGSSWISYAAAAAVFALVFVIQRHEPFFPDLTIAGVAVLVAMLVATGQFLGQRALVTEQAKNEDLLGELRHQAFHDTLTGLANRALFNERLEHALARRRSSSVNHAVLVIDLDGFKSVNDSLGRRAGDEVLRSVAGRLCDAVRRADTVARVGGTEFAILLEDVTSEAEAVEVVEHLLNAIRQPLTAGERTLSPEASIGVALTDEEPRTADELLRCADTAMYRAKQERHGRYVVFETAMQTALSERVELEADLRGAVGRGELRVFYQPILDLARLDVVAFEALVRWMHPARGLLPPVAFLAVAEQCGLIHEIDTWVLFEACAEAARWRQMSSQFARVSVHVNLSPLQLHEPDLIDTVTEALLAARLDSELLTLELVESSVVNDLELAQARLTELKALGVRLAVDDFGTGYSSLSHLRTLPIDELKIDRSFIAAIETSPQSRTLVHTLIQLGAALGIDTVAEGIEESEQLARLREENCLQGQGYLFARPLDHDGLRAYLLARARPPSATDSVRATAAALR